MYLLGLYLNTVHSPGLSSMACVKPLSSSDANSRNLEVRFADLLHGVHCEDRTWVSTAT